MSNSPIPGRPAADVVADEDEAVDAAATTPPPAKRPRGGQCQPWSQRRSEFLALIGDKYPHFSLDEAFAEEAWPDLVKGKDSRITGKCARCAVAVSASIAHIMGKQGLPKCKTESCRHATQAAAPAENVAVARGEEGGGWQADDSEPRPKLNHNSDFKVVMDFFATYHPTVRLAARLRCHAGWESSIVSQASVIEATCTLCGAERACAAQNILFNGQGFCRPCKILTSGLEDAMRLYRHANVAISNPHMAAESAKSQRYLHVDLECLNRGCGWKGVQSVRYHKVLRNRDPTLIINPCKKCNDVLPWKGEAGFGAFLQILEHYKETRFYTSAITLSQWLQRVENQNSLVRIRCVLCDETRDVRLSNFQQGGSVGCGCLRSAVAFEAELTRLLPHARVRAEVSLKDATGTFDFVMLRDRAEYLQTCHDFGVGAAQEIPLIAFELDGPQHFSLVIYGYPNEEIGKRDFCKDLTSCEAGVTLIRLQQRSLWREAASSARLHLDPPSPSSWKEYLRSALAFALQRPGGRIICEDAPNYVDDRGSAYARLREGTALAGVVRDPALGQGVIRRLAADHIPRSRRLNPATFEAGVSAAAHTDL